MMTGQRISHFEILDKLGEGGMGVVYKARDLDLNRFVALKMLPVGVGADPSRRARFLQEAQAASALNHPNIVTVYEIFREGGNEFIAMEYLDGKTLGDLIGPRGLKIEEALRLGEQIATALAAAHGAGIVHRDLKPANVMVTGLGLAKVLDFGLAKLTETGPEDATLTEAGTVMGTLAYMSPEQAEGRRVDWRSDIFSFGTLLYEMVTGRRAFDGEGRVQTLAAVMEKEPAALGNAVPRELQRLIARCMKKKAGERSQSMVDVKHALEELRAEIASGAMSGVHAAGPVKKASRWPLAAAAVVVLAVGGIWMMRGGKPEAVIYKPVPFTSYPGLEQDPALSPDGKFVAFSWNGPNQDNFDIYVRRVGPGEPLRLTQSPGPDRFPAWSPNGDMVAFHRGAAESAGVYVVPALGGTERRVSRGNRTVTLSVTWTPDGKALLLSSLHWFTLLSVETGEESRLTLPIERKSHFHTVYPAFSPDGRELAFVVSDSVEGDSLYIVGWSAANKVEGPGRVLTVGRSGAYRSLAWSADGKSIYVADSQGGIPKPFRLTASGDAAPELMAGLGEHITAISASGTRLVYGNQIQDLDLWRVEIGGGKMGSATPFLKSTRSEGAPSFSPNGKEIAFISDRSGEAELWVANSDGTNLRQLTKAAPVYYFSWSADGSELLYTASPVKGSALFRIRSQGGIARQVGPVGVTQGRWMPDGKTIVYTAAPGSDTYRLYKNDAEGKNAPEGIEGSVLNATTDRSEWYLSADGRDLWRMSAPGRIGETPIRGLIRQRLPDGELVVLAAKNGVGAYSFEPEGVYFVAVDSDVLRYCRYSDNKVTDIATLPERFLRGGRTRFTVSPDGKTLIFSKADETISDLYLVEGVSK